MQQWYKCPQCGKDIKYGKSPCPYCKWVLDWRQQQPTVYMPPPGYSAPQEQVVQPPVVASQQQLVQPHVEGMQQPVPTANRAGGGITCVNCGNQIVPVKKKLDCGCLILCVLLGVFPAIIYAIVYFSQRAEICPVCEKNVYKLGP